MCRGVVRCEVWRSRSFFEVTHPRAKFSENPRPEIWLLHFESRARVRWVPRRAASGPRMRQHVARGG